ncbi:integral membrane sensor signal transduction histidine kinase [Cellulomonas flavigena DSM 20109]|uniref:histidine kinase n=1 Tax=Cellulomonas flavigena (strain ATCC 482 / DSM 20109 / BCRC 11376 / JCM 18109 / NBRC 3775 / NCIMB 8073 / NRS 134) TaxID=446466 RepID=D5UK24_CELFN|nr:sensor histidine kinase [Cellulomonas flavigena]ADG73766.1 integral membrane sensor signal transduction histidine kinase [Cellulomonas flavigena DSM 20109]
MRGLLRGVAARVVPDEQAPTGPAAERAADGGPVGRDVAVVGPVPVVVAADPDEPGWVRPGPSSDVLRWDVLLAVALCLGGLLSMALSRLTGMLYEEPAEGWVSALMIAAVTLPLAVRRRWPSAALLVVAAAFVGSQLLYVPETLISNIALFCAMYTVGAWETDRRRGTVARAVVVAGMIVWLLVAMFRAATDPELAAEIAEEFPEQVGAISPLVAAWLVQLLTNVLYFAGAWFFGAHAWRSARERARTAWRTHLLVLERRRAEEQAVALERLRLARELHDAVAHHVSLIGVQAAAARTVLGSDTERAAQALGHVEDAAREAVSELHGILGMLRDGSDAARGAAAVPEEPVTALDVGRLPELVAQARTAGLEVSYREVGEPRRLPPLASLHLYRIAQEALTNTRKHAGPGVRADVRLRWLPGAVELEVSDDGGAGRRPGPVPSGGMGLVGMRERVAAEGGTFEAARRRAGGFVVRARLPLPGDDASDDDAAAAARGTEDET